MYKIIVLVSLFSGGFSAHDSEMFNSITIVTTKASSIAVSYKPTDLTTDSAPASVGASVTANAVINLPPTNPAATEHIPKTTATTPKPVSEASETTSNEVTKIPVTPVASESTSVAATTEKGTTNNDANVKINPDCGKKPCVNKCCPDNHIVQIKNDYSCVKVQNNYEFPTVRLVTYKEYKSVSPTNKTVNDTFILVSPTKPLNFSDYFCYPLNIRLPRKSYHLAVDGTFIVDVYNYAPHERWSYRKPNTTCLANKISPKRGVMPLICLKVEPVVTSQTLHLTVGMLISCFFLGLVLVVYGLLPKLRNLRGLILMSCVASLMVGFLVFATLNLLSDNGKATTVICKNFSLISYFLMLSSFFWLNVMSYDIFWTFRGFAKARPINRRGEWCKYLTYCLYAWGIPVVLTVAMVLVDAADLRRWPWFIKPHIEDNRCFLSDACRFYYMHVPMLVLLLSNVLLFVMTVFNMVRMSRGLGLLDRAAAAAGSPAAHVSQKQRFILYLKLSVVMGVSWILEVVGALKPEMTLFVITDMYNLAIGVIIFYIFVCKKKIWRELVKKFEKRMVKYRLAPGSLDRWLGRSSSQAESSAADTESSQVFVEVPLAVCPAPQGPKEGHKMRRSHP